MSTRKHFLLSSIAALSFAVVMPTMVLAQAGYIKPGEKLNNPGAAKGIIIDNARPGAQKGIIIDNAKGVKCYTDDSCAPGAGKTGKKKLQAGKNLGAKSGGVQPGEAQGFKEVEPGKGPPPRGTAQGIVPIGPQFNPGGALATPGMLKAGPSPRAK